MSNLAIIPARGGSKRIPRKNIKKFLGKPILAYSIEAALESGLFSEVMVSTDDDEIAEVAEKYGARVPFRRSKKNSNDFATTVDVILEVLNFYDIEGHSFDNVCCIYSTAPFIKVQTLIEANEVLKKNNYSTVFPVVQFDFPIWRGLVVHPSGYVKMIWPENQKKRSQDLPISWHDAGQFYWIKKSVFMNDPQLYGRNSGAVKISQLEAQDIDTISDWKFAELKARFLNE